MTKHLWDAPTEEFKDHLGPLAENLQALIRIKEGDMPSLRMLARTVSKKLKLRAEQCELSLEEGAAKDVVDACGTLEELAQQPDPLAQLE